MNRDFLVRLAAQLVGNALLGALAWYWLSLGVSSIPLVAFNALLALLMLLGWSLLDAHGLGQWRHWRWALPAVALTPLIAVHYAAALLVLLLWVTLLLPSAAAGAWRLILRPDHLVISLGLLTLMIGAPWLLLHWIPGVQGLTPELLSFALRAGLAFAIAITAWTALLWQSSRAVTSAETVSLPEYGS